MGYEYPGCGLVCLVAGLGCGYDFVVWETKGGGEKGDVKVVKG